MTRRRHLSSDFRPRHALHGRALHLLMFVLAFAASTHPLSARELMTQEEALLAAFGKEAAIERENLFLTKSQIEAIEKACECDLSMELVPRYEASKEGRPVGWAYFDAHLVRTLPETLMVVVNPNGSVARIEILSFREPMDYFPSSRWLDQFDGRKLDDELSLRRGIRPISGATLTGRAITAAVRRILAIHEVATREGRGP